MLRSNLRLIYIYISITLAFVACSSNQSDPRIRDITLTMESLGLKEMLHSKAIIILPNAGCEGCITNTELFVKDNISGELGLTVVLTGTTSKKNIRLKLGEELLKNKNVYLDLNSHFYQKGMVGLYPVILYTRNNEIFRLEEQSPSTPNALDSLQSFLRSN